ncbi:MULTISPECIES: DUF3284 domain-containing protein [Lacticaseibacillus]|uniref:DUF3284 domain-containing protein n=2 Tax=Lacticaseibacillus TaxID=2759736 RepID=A0ABW4CH66_9LACO|nr:MULTISPECIES: DUF3284 domain-containing protein [Lacticaseibacillus]
MVIETDVDVPVAFFYQRVIASVLYDIKQATGQDVPASKLQGYSYGKSFGKNKSGRIVITKNILNKGYAFETRTASGTYSVDYDIQETQAGTTHVVYNETSEFNSASQNANQGIMAFVFGRRRKRQFKLMMDQIAASYRDGSVGA